MTPGDRQQMSGDFGTVTVWEEKYSWHPVGRDLMWLNIPLCRTAPRKNLYDLTAHCTKVRNLGLKERKKIQSLCLWIAKPAQA